MASILCIEDEMEIRLDIAYELSEAGYEVFQAENGKQGLKAVAEKKPDLVLCDISMPVMDGRQFVGEVREKYPSMSHMPIIFLTALADRKDEIVGKKLGADDYLRKPVDYGLLLATVEARLREVERVKKKQSNELVALYKTLSSAKPSVTVPPPAAAPVQPKPEKSSMTVASVTDVATNLSPVLKGLRSKGHTVVEMNSGKGFLDVFPAMSLDLCLLSIDTADLQGSMILHFMREDGPLEFPVVLVIPPAESMPNAQDHISGFDKCLAWPSEVSKFIEKIEILSTERKLKRGSAL